nr:hypothetical protein [Tanacetum cinerariifolium]
MVNTMNNDLVLNTPPSTDPIQSALAAIQETLASIQAKVRLHSTEIACLKREEGTSQPRTDELTAQLRPHPEPNNNPYGKLIRIEFLKFSGDDEHFEVEVVKRIGVLYDDPIMELKNLKQTGSVQHCQGVFEALLNKVYLPEPIDLAKMQEATNTILKPRYNTPLLPIPKQSTPTTTYASKAMTTLTKTNSVGQNSRYVTRNGVHKPYRLTQKELEDKRAKGQCFYCDQKFIPGHKCSGQLHSIKIIAESDLDNYIDGDDEIYEDCVDDMYPDVYFPSQETSEEVFQAKGDLIKSIQTFLEEFNCIPFEEKPQILLQAWFKFFTIQRAQPENSNELFQKLFEDLKELADALNYKLLSINSNSQRLDKKEQEVKNVVEQPAKRGTRVEKSLQNFRVIHKNSISLNTTPQISPVHAVAPILSTKEPEHSLSMGDDESLPDEDVPTEEFKVDSNPLFDEDEINSDKLDPHCFNVESDFVESLLNRDTFIDSSSKFDFSGELAHVNPEITESDFDFEEEIHLSESLLYDNSSSQLSKEHNADEERIKREHADYISRMEMLFTINPHPRPTMNANINVESLPLLPIPVRDNDSQREDIDIVINTDDVLPPGVENDDSDEEVDVVDDLRVDNSISNSEHESSESEESDFDNPSVPLPPPEPPDEELDFEIAFGDEILVVRNTIVEFECIDARVEFDVSNDENNGYSYFMFVMFAKVFSLLSAENEDTIFDHGFAPQRLKFSCVGYLSRFTRSSHPFLEISLGRSISFDQYCLAVEYLGHIISAQGVSTDPFKIEAMRKWPIPSILKQLRGFLGLTGYYRRFIKDYASINQPLVALTKKDAFKWNPSAELAYHKLKEAMIKAPVLALPNFEYEFMVETDASGKGIRAVLCQNGHPIAYWSKTLSAKHQALSTYEK